MTTIRLIIVSLAFALTVNLAIAANSNENAALRKKCAHALKVKMGIKDTGSVDDLRSVSNAAQQVDQCVAAGGKLN